ncbi:hypothetical protein C8A01DRAFT_15361 [Parachaetomium inaequale]|uniref:TRP C-terminal domain-containing protein n=1 Tax=Parachaetomium inaequale TaxID=2588326 RepID=A0AAN6SSU4_9PEZI|nr:hypothetical protein C8A01DRAFT_15361 [Parachaetomium inaequale]
MALIAGTLPAPALIIAVLAFIAALIPPAADAAYVQSIPCSGGRGAKQALEHLWPTSSRARVLPSDDSSPQSDARLELEIHADYKGKATCAELLADGPPYVTIMLDGLDLSKTSTVRPSNWTCLSYTDRPAWEQQYLAAQTSDIRFIAQHDLGVLGLLPAFSARFIFFLGALTLRYPGFYQPVTSLFHWSALFNPTGPFGQDWRYDRVKDGIYEINGTLTGSYGLELMSQITGGPVTMDVWYNMVVIVAVIIAVLAVFMLAHKSVSHLVQPPSFSSPPDQGLGQGPAPAPDSAVARGMWNVLRVVLSYFLAPIVAISAYQLDNLLLPTYHLALAALLIVLVIIGLTWMWRSAPSNQLWVLLLDSSKRYHRVRTDDPDNDRGPDRGPDQPGKQRDIFAGIFFAVAFIRGAAVGGLQFAPLPQVIVLAVTELALLVSTVVLWPPQRWALSVSMWSGAARLVVVALTAAFLPEVDAKISARSRVGIVILVIHAAVLALGCVMPAIIRLAIIVYSRWAATGGPEIYGLSQLGRRHNAVNNLSVDIPSPIAGSTYNPRRADSPASYRSHSPRSPSDGSRIGLYINQHSSPDALYLQAVPQNHYFRPPRSSSSTSQRRSYAASSNISSTTSQSRRSAHRRVGSPTTVTSSSSIIPARPRRSDTSTSDGTISDTSQPPLLPLVSPTPPLPAQSPDYSVREADLYYGHGRPHRAENFGDAAAAGASTAETPSPHHQKSTVRRVMSGMRDQLTGRKSGSVEKEPAHKGFEVRRPPRPADS